MKKYYVLDTNVILHDCRSLFSFDEHHVVIPITVLEELDKFKKGNNMINFHAREFVRELNKLTKDTIFKEGVSLGKRRGHLFVETGKSFSENLTKSFPESIPDHRILAIAEHILETKKPNKVILVTKDINLRMKAKSIGIPAEDYRTDHVEDIDKLFVRDVNIYDDFDKNKLNLLIHKPHKFAAKELKNNNHFDGNIYFIFKNKSLSALAYFNPYSKFIEKVEKTNVYGIIPRNAEQTFAFHALLNKKISLVAITGKAGTGKTLLALASALKLEKAYESIYVARPIVALSNKDLGYLPGDVDEKIRPYMEPLFDNITVIKHAHPKYSKNRQRIDEIIKEEKMIITPLAYIRGRSLSNAYFIVDEAQNLTPHEIKTIITRAGENTKMVFVGDVEQIDSPYLDKHSNGLTYLSDRMAGQDIFSHINLVKGERSYLAELASHLL